MSKEKEVLKDYTSNGYVGDNWADILDCVSKFNKEQLIIARKLNANKTDSG